MSFPDPPRQIPAPGTRLLLFCGDHCTFRLAGDFPGPGRGWLRTNLGHGGIAREEIIQSVRSGGRRPGQDWHDLPMVPGEDGGFFVSIPLCEVGHFEAKCFYLPDGAADPVWPPGSNVTLNVEPAHTCCANIVYNAFVRQFGADRSGGAGMDPRQTAPIQALEHAGYAVIPPSGTFRDLIGRLDLIIDTLGCTCLLLLPIQPTPTVYGRMGRFGSPYAALDFTGIDPALAEFDPRSTPLDQFTELVDAVHARDAALLLDMPVNHTGWAARIHERHPEWLARETDGRIENPGAWGTVWEDLTRLDYRRKELWDYVADAFLTWCRRGVDGFRCDAGYMIPVAVWEYIVALVRREYPDTVFLLEGLGGKISVTREILDRANFNWAYSEFFQQYDRAQIEGYFPESDAISRSDGLMIHFAETHDNNRLAARSIPYARMRTALSALFSANGAFGFANGVEWFATEKIDVHERPSLDWGSPENQVAAIRTLTTLLRRHPAFHDRVETLLIPQGSGEVLALARRHPPTGKRVLVLANLDVDAPGSGSWEARDFPTEQPIDLLTGAEVPVERASGRRACRLAPGQVLCLTGDPADLALLSSPPPTGTDRPTEQRLTAKALSVWRHLHDKLEMPPFDPDTAASRLALDPEGFCADCLPEHAAPRVVPWQWPADLRREVMVPPGHLLLVRSPVPFRAELTDGSRTLAPERGLPSADGAFFALFEPLAVPPRHTGHKLKLVVHEGRATRRDSAAVCFLADPGSPRVRRRFERADSADRSRLLLATNGRGGMLRANLFWGALQSKYDALLAANLSPRYPEDRWVMFTRCRGWISRRGFSQEIRDDWLIDFRQGASFTGHWRFRLPMGGGNAVPLTIKTEMLPDENAVRMTFRRPSGPSSMEGEEAIEAVRLVLRPDIEDRNFHENTKAYAGPERSWPAAVSDIPGGFAFIPDPRRGLSIRVAPGTFTRAPEWRYAVHHPVEEQRGLDPHTDLFSPGYFTVPLIPGKRVTLLARITTDEQPDEAPIPRAGIDASDDRRADPRMEEVDLSSAMCGAVDQYVVKRGDLRTVIAGYPWFLDWGRDTLIFVRGLIAMGRTRESRAILSQFAAFESDGTLPNMIRGQDAGNRDTSDAPLWFFAGCADLIRAEGTEAFLDLSSGGRTVREILVSMGRSLLSKTANGVGVDEASGLLFSPSHFTWMDTNYPAATPREGYPIEIQALWHFALSFLSRIDPEGEQARRSWQGWADRVRGSIETLFFLEPGGYLSDCLHGASGTPAHRAEPDDALRPNQLFALTMGAFTDPRGCRRVLAACRELLVPGAIRSLADRPVSRPLPVVRQGVLLNDPHAPYWGRYGGDEDTRRKPAYHNGTAWTWVYPSFAEAWVKVHGESGRRAAMAWMAGSSRLVDGGAIGHLPEILDGDSPHDQRGCDAQAWGASEWIRVWKWLGEGEPSGRLWV